MRRFILTALGALLLVVGLTPLLSLAQGRPVDVRILAINDFHGNLEPANLSYRLPNGQTVPVGGVEYLATHIQALRRGHAHTVVVSAGDAIGASPLLSALFHDEPTIEALDQVGLDLNAVGNHEFDDGAAELLRMQRGGCHPTEGCLDGDGFTGARFQFLAANVRTAQGKTLLPPYQIRRFTGIPVAFIGMTLEGTPRIVAAAGVAGLTFQDEAETVNALVPELRRQGVRAIVVLVHEGGLATGSYDDCPAISGAIVDIVRRTDPEVDLFITGHTHQAYNCRIDGRPVTSAASFGRLITTLDLTLDPRTRDVATVQAANQLVTQDVPKSAPLTALIAKYEAVAGPIRDRPIGTLTADFTRDLSPAGESALGRLIADAQLAATAAPDQGGAVIALMNPGGIRADLTYRGQGQVTYGEAFAVQPFGGTLVTLSLTGDQIRQVLEQQFDNPVMGQNRILQVSTGFSYTWDATAPTGKRVGDLRLQGQALRPEATYRVTVNSFLADGGDNFTVFQEGRDRRGGVGDIQALETYLARRSPIAPDPAGRITRKP